MKKIFTGILLLCIAPCAFSQTKEEKKYKEEATGIANIIWNNGNKAFEVVEIPEKYKNESAVIIARQYELSSTRDFKFKAASLFGDAEGRQYKFSTTERERVLINDKNALEEYSTLNYKKLLKKTDDGSFYTVINTYRTYIGAKVYKKDGRVIPIVVDKEEVLTKNDKTEKDGRLAIPDLQAGDILDYYIHVEEQNEDGPKLHGPDYFFLRNEYPLLYYNVKFTFHKKCGVDIINANGAKPMLRSVNENGDRILEITEYDLPKIGNKLWSSPLRQFPYYVVRYGFYGSKTMAEPGDIKSDKFTEQSIERAKEYFIKRRIYIGQDFFSRKNIENYFGGKDRLQKVSADSIINYLYNYFHDEQYAIFISKLKVSKETNSAYIDAYYFASVFNVILDEYHIDNEIVLASGRNMTKLDNVLNSGDFEPMIKLYGTKIYKWLSFTDLFHNTGQLIADKQGEPAVALKFVTEKRSKFVYKDSIVQLPTTNASENSVKQNLHVTFNKEDVRVIKIDRKTSEAGAMKQDDQKKLLLAEEVERGFSKVIKKETIVEFLTRRQDKPDLLNEHLKAFEIQKPKQKDYFIDNIRSEYDLAPKELISYQILNNGFSADSPVFEYSSVFTMDNFVKTAGNNLIFEIGKLMGSYPRIMGKERNREIDVYMPCARTFNYTFNIKIPEGYKVKGLETLDKTIENETANFNSNAKLEGADIVVNVTRTYKNNFEPAANWPKLLAVMDAAADFTETKILFESTNRSR